MIELPEHMTHDGDKVRMVDGDGVVWTLDHRTAAALAQARLERT